MVDANQRVFEAELAAQELEQEKQPEVIRVKRPQVRTIPLK